MQSKSEKGANKNAIKILQLMLLLSFFILLFSLCIYMARIKNV